MSENRKERIVGTWYSIATFLMWGFLPIYWKALKEVPASEILLHRIIWSFLFLALYISLKKRWPVVRETYAIVPNRLSSLICALLLGINWFIFIWAVNADHLVEISMGYYINPLLSVLLGMLILRERLTLWQWVAFALALLGVAYMTIQYGRVPWIALTLAVTFGIYGLIRKTARVGALTGFAGETAILSPTALVFLILLLMQGGSVVGKASLSVHLLLIGTGIVTALPLVWFARGARRIPLSSVGFIQYLAPTCHLLLGVFLYGESFTRVHAVSFSLIWIALIIYSVSQLRSVKRSGSATFS
ncbi:EamA family transporter RarD [Acidobacteriota bacterium]